MNLRTEVLIVGAGLAGASVSHFLGRSREVLLVDGDAPARGASAAAAGLVNPLLGRRARPVWEMRPALEALSQTLGAVAPDIRYDRNGVLRPALNTEQARRFSRAAARYEDLADWLTPDEVMEAFPHIRAPQGALRIREGGALNIPDFCRRLLAGAEVRSGWRLVGWDEGNRTVGAHFVTPGGRAIITADVMILAMGEGFRHFAETRRLDLHCVKGQTVTVELDEALPHDHPHVAGLGYIVVEPPVAEPGGRSRRTRLVLGSTYQHEFDDAHPSASATEEILDKTRAIMPEVDASMVIGERAGIRVTVPRTRLPMVGVLPGFRRSWIFSGLGAKGLLMAPLIGQRLPLWLTAPERIPYDLRPRVRE